MEKINVMLYGGFDKNKKNRAEIVYCDKCDNCSFYEKGYCLNVTTPLQHGCKYGHVERKDGYTKRAQKRYIFDNKYKSDECYGRLQHPTDWVVAMIDEVVVFNLRLVVVDTKQYIGGEWKNTDTYKPRESGLFSTGTISYVPLENITVDLLKSIIDFKPRTVMDNKVIKEYTDKVVPNMLFELKLLLPKTYSDFISCYEDYKEVTPNFVGRYAYINTLEDGTIIKDSSGTFIKQDNKLISENYSSAFLPFSCKKAKLEIEITDKMVCKITNNEQVSLNTILK